VHAWITWFVTEKISTAPPTTEKTSSPLTTTEKISRWSDDDRDNGVSGE
jgi:hypothetical protein